jgi:restriction system protein
MGRKRSDKNLPTFDQLMIPILESLIELGGSGSIEEINEKVYERVALTEEQLGIPHGIDGRTEAEYRLAWSRTYLKKAGLLENSSRGIWALTNFDIDVNSVDIDEIVRSYRDATRPQKAEKGISGSEELELEVEAGQDWKEKLLNSLYNITASAFERLAQRLCERVVLFKSK